MDLKLKELNLKKEEIAYDLMSKLDKGIVEKTNLTYDKIIEYIYYILEYIAASIELEEDRIIIDYLFWLKKLLQNNGLPEGIVESNLEGLNHMIYKHTSNKQIARILNKAIHTLKNEAPLEIDLETSDYLEREAKEYLSLVLSQKKAEANALIHDLVNNPEIIFEDIYYYIFERSQNEVGAMWERDEISVAEEHYVSAFTQTLIASLYPYVFQKPITKEKVILMAIENESHELGIRMIADLFSLDGWDAQYYGADVPIDDILLTIKTNKPYMVVISATFSKNIVYVKRLIENLKAEGIDTNIFVGGYAFNGYPHLAKSIGADYYTKNSKEVIKIANKMLQNENRLKK